MILNREMVMNGAKAALHQYHDWAVRLLARTHAIYECQKHAYFMDNDDEEAVDDAVKLAAADPPMGLSPDEAAKVVRKAMGIIGYECPGCASDARQ
jgi:hypothetical protein